MDSVVFLTFSVKKDYSCVTLHQKTSSICTCSTRWTVQVENHLRAAFNSPRTACAFLNAALWRGNKIGDGFRLYWWCFDCRVSEKRNRSFLLCSSLLKSSVRKHCFFIYALQLNFADVGPNFVVIVAVAQNRMNDMWECKTESNVYWNDHLIVGLLCCTFELHSSTSSSSTVMLQYFFVTWKVAAWNYVFSFEHSSLICIFPGSLMADLALSNEGVTYFWPPCRVITVSSSYKLLSCHDLQKDRGLISLACLLWQVTLDTAGCSDDSWWRSGYPCLSSFLWMRGLTLPPLLISSIRNNHSDSFEWGQSGSVYGHSCFF